MSVTPAAIGPHTTISGFIDFVVAGGSFGKRLSTVEQAIAFREDTTPFAAKAFYLPVRNSIIDFIRTGDRTNLDRVLATCPDNRRAHYVEISDGVSRWVGRRALVSTSVSTRRWTAASGLVVTVNPELGIERKNGPCVVKLYFKAEAPSKRVLDPMLRLMEITHGADANVAILDTRRAKLHAPTRTVRGIDTILESEAAAYSSLWNSLVVTGSV